MAAGPDEGFAWVIALACFFINFIMAGLARTVGVLYVAIIDLYGVSREAATTPFSIRVCVRNMTGPLVGLLGLKYGIRGVTAIGGLIAALGSIFCYFAPNVLWITIFWGVIHGLGFGLSTVLHMIAINQYFHKYRASALGLGYSGDCFGSFVFPIFMEYLFANFDVRGTFLIIGGIVLNVIPMALLLRKPPWIKGDRNRSKSKTEANKPHAPTTLIQSTNTLLLQKNKALKTRVQSSGFLSTVSENEVTEREQVTPKIVHKSILKNRNIPTITYDLKGQCNQGFNLSETDLNILNKETDVKNTAIFTLGIPENSMNANNLSGRCKEIDNISCNSNTKIEKIASVDNILYKPTEIRTSRSASELCSKLEMQQYIINRSLRLEKKPYCNLQSQTEWMPPLFEKEKGAKDGPGNTELSEIVKKSTDLENENHVVEEIGTPKKRTSSFASQVAHDLVNRMRTASFASQVAQDAFVMSINQESESDSEQELECELKSIVEHKDHDVENCTHEDLVLSVNKNVMDDGFNSLSEAQEVILKDKQKSPSILKVLIRTNVKPMFILISLSMGVYAFLFTAVITIIIDYASDQGISSDRGKYLIIGFSVADLIGRLTFGQVIDRNLMKMKNYAGSTILLMGILTASVPLNISLNYMMVCMSMYGFVQGGTAIMFPILVNTYMDKGSEAVAMGCLNFYGGLLMLLLAPMIGFFRDKTGSYNSVFYITGGVVAVVGIIWQFEPMIIKFQNRKLREKYIMNEIHASNLQQ